MSTTLHKIKVTNDIENIEITCVAVNPGSRPASQARRLDQIITQNLKALAYTRINLPKKRYIAPTLDRYNFVVILGFSL
jgi:hypothetical protein